MNITKSFSLLSHYIAAFGPELLLKKELSSWSDKYETAYIRAVEKKLVKDIVPQIHYCRRNEVGLRTVGETCPIWFMWWQGKDNAPDLVKAMWRNRLEYAGRHPVILIDKDNFASYTERSVHIYEYVKDGRITITHFSDFLRMELLYRYGGIWTDASLFMTKKFDDWVKDSRLFTIKQGEIDVPGLHWRPSWSRKWTTYCLGGAAGEPLFGYVMDFLDAYWRRFDIVIDYLLTDRILNIAYQIIPDVHQSIDAIPESNPWILSMALHMDDPAKSFPMYKDTSIYKLSWKDSHERLTADGQDTVYGSILRKYGI